MSDNKKRPWEEAVERYMGMEKSLKDQANALYIQRWHRMPPQWRNDNNCGPEDAKMLMQAIADIIGDYPVDLSSQANEYEEAMKAEEIMARLK